MSIINRESFADQIYEDLKRDIISHRIGFNQKLTNRELQEKYGVSSTPVRDAINRLYLDGFVVEINKSGAKTIGFDRKFALELNEIVSVLSDDALRMSAAKSDIFDVGKMLEANIRQHDQHLYDDAFFTCDDEFHLIFFKACKNDAFVQLYEKYSVLRHILVRYSLEQDKKERELGLEQHKMIYQAYVKGNINLACERMHDHYRRAMVFIQKGFKD